MAPSAKQNEQIAPGATSSPLPDKQQKIDKMIEKLGDVITAIEAHPLFIPPKPQQTLYFMWDFIQRSRHMLQNLPSNKGKADEQLQDVMGRCLYTEILINDTTGKLAIMTGADPKNPVDFGDDVRRAMEEMTKVI